jgi:hypothetical protein
MCLLSIDYEKEGKPGFKILCITLLYTTTELPTQFCCMSKGKSYKNGPFRVIMFLSIYRTGGDVCMMLMQFINTI